MWKRFEDFEKEAQQYRQILINYRDKGEVFTDPNFHPTANIPESDVSFSYTDWIRVDEIYPTPLFKKELIKPDFVRQGAIGDCYFVSALVQLSTQPYLVPYLFDHKSELYLGKEEDSINLKCGAVVIYFHAFGRKTPVLIDTLLPCYHFSREPYFSRPVDKTKSAWFCLVEKAYAKLYGSYSEIVSGDLTQSIYALYGYYSSMKNMSEIKSSKKMLPFEILLKHKEKGAILGTSIHADKLDGVTEEEITKKGLVSIHSYLILQLKQYENKNFICLRNPWGDTEWNGDWSDHSDLWTEQMKQDFGLKVGNDGTFWMIDTDFFKYFSEISITKPIPPKWHKKHIFYRMQPLLDEKATIVFKDHQGICFRIKDEDAQNKEKSNKVIIVAERRHKLLDDDGNLNKGPPVFCCPVGLKSFLSIFLSTPGRVLSVNDRAWRDKSESRYCLYHKGGICEYYEDVYVTFFCELDFDLYDEKSPEDLMPEDKRSGVFYNFSLLNRECLKRKNKNLEKENLPEGEDNLNMEKSKDESNLSGANREKENLPEGQNKDKTDSNEQNKDKTDSNEPNKDKTGLIEPNKDKTDLIEPNKCKNNSSEKLMPERMRMKSQSNKFRKKDKRLSNVNEERNPERKSKDFDKPRKLSQRSKNDQKGEFEQLDDVMDEQVIERRKPWESEQLLSDQSLRRMFNEIRNDFYLNHT